MFEIWLPTIARFRGLAIPDHRDVFFYALGALIAGLTWLRYYRPTPLPSAQPDTTPPPPTNPQP
ncbi:MAG: hypothetical protein CMJ49_03550 [Planctomycetaceae bacterium]|nr:hypothetical protein [Planctomycetaceae bacterium]